jgi:cell division initiation protein
MTSMKLTPQDILTQKFNARSKGFDKEEVTGFLAQVAELLENEILERDRLRNKIDKLKKSLSKYENREDILRDTLIAAQKFSEEIKSNARKEAELITKEAEMKAEEIINSAVSRQRELKEEIRNLKFKRQEIESDLLNMLDSLKELIESYRKDDEEFDKVEYLGK